MTQNNEYNPNICPKCKEFMPMMSGVRIEGHPEHPLFLCFNCKCWFDKDGNFIQTI
jgi:hypothetical protein